MATSATKMNGSKTSATTADLSAEIETLRNDIASLTQTIADLGRTKGEDAAEIAKSKVEDVKRKVADTGETAQLHALEMQAQATGFVRDQPAAALGIAAGIGFLIGMLGSRK